MPFVTESRDATERSYRCVGYDGVVRFADFAVGKDEKQTGFRSGQLSRQEYAALGLTAPHQRSLTQADTLRVIQDLDLEYNSRPGRVADGVNSRLYESVGHVVNHANWSTAATRITTGLPLQSSGSGLIELTSQISQIPGSKPAENILRGEASGMMRRSVPTAPAFNLTRALGELRHAPLMLRASNYNPRSLKEAGGSYLNFVFGLSPTAKDIASLASTIIDADRILRDFINHQGQIVRRRRSMEMYRSNREWTFTPPSDVRSSLVLRDGSATFGSITAFCPPWGRDASFSSRSAMTYHVRADVVGVLRMFASFEYFIPRPSGLLGRLDLYLTKARKLLGGGFDVNTAYALAPWSWLADWFIDIGGLLRYQESVAANSVVASRSGWVYDLTNTVSSYGSRRSTFSAVTGPSTLETASKYYRREPGGPYSLTDGWALTGSQWTILAALGLSRQSRF